MHRFCERIKFVVNDGVVHKKWTFSGLSNTIVLENEWKIERFKTVRTNLKKTIVHERWTKKIKKKQTLPASIKKVKKEINKITSSS